MKLTLSETQLQQQINYFAYYQLVSGVLMTVFIAYLLATAQSLSGLVLLLFTSGFALAGFIIYCGYLTLRQPARGLRFSRINLLTQFLGVSASGFAFRFFAGPFLALGIDLSQDFLFKADAGLGNFSFKVNGVSDTLVLSINLVAMLLYLRTTTWLNEWQARHKTSELSITPQQP